MRRFTLTANLVAVAAALLATGCSSGPEPAPQPAPTEQKTESEPAGPTCPVAGSEPVEIQMPTTSGEALMVGGLDHDRLWNSDLNADGMPDMILQQRGACNADDECMTSIWVGCGPSTFTKVWGTDFAYELYVLEQTTDVDGSPWVVIERGIPPTGDGEGIGTEVLVFDGSAYRPQK